MARFAGFTITKSHAMTAAMAFGLLVTVSSQVSAEATPGTLTPAGPPDADRTGTVGESGGRTVRYRVHRSPIRADDLVIHVVADDGARELAIALPDLEGLSYNRICRDEGRARIACGSRGRIQLVNFIARKETACRIASPDAVSRPVACTIDGVDLAEWMVRAGIARPLDGRFAAAEREAQRAGRGLWADAETRRSRLAAAAVD